MNPTIGINSSIDGWTVAKITRTGVLLKNSTGSNLTLSFSETEKLFKC